MNKKTIYRSMAGLVMAGFSLTSLTGCMEVTEPASNIATEEQIQNSPSSSESFLMAMPAYFNKVNTSWVKIKCTSHLVMVPSCIYVT